MVEEGVPPQVLSQGWRHVEHGALPLRLVPDETLPCVVSVRFGTSHGNALQRHGRSGACSSPLGPGARPSTSALVHQYQWCSVAPEGYPCRYGLGFRLTLVLAHTFEHSGPGGDFGIRHSPA